MLTTTISITQPSIQGPIMHFQSSRPSSPPSPSSFFRPTHKPRRSISSFDSRQSIEQDGDDSPMNRPSLHQILRNQGRGQYTLDNFAAFLQSQFCYENLAFWLASRQYR
ncbi:hypothetical protein BX616_006619, partial [Lobosporangium transversale]